VKDVEASAAENAHLRQQLAAKDEHLAAKDKQIILAACTQPAAAKKIEKETDEKVPSKPPLKFGVAIRAARPWSFTATVSNAGGVCHPSVACRRRGRTLSTEWPSV
jgi:hypothetical protein